MHTNHAVIILVLALSGALLSASCGPDRADTPEVAGASGSAVEAPLAPSSRTPTVDAIEGSDEDAENTLPMSSFEYRVCVLLKKDSMVTRAAFCASQSAADVRRPLLRARARQRRCVGQLVLQRIRRMSRDPFVFRRYSIVGEPEREVVLTISKPKPALGDWACVLRIEGVPNAREVVPGIDPLQCLQLALQRARQLLDASGLQLTWFGSEPGDVGIPLTVPTVYGFSFQRKLERHVRRESRRFDEAVATFLREKDRVQGMQRGRRRGAARG